MASLPFVLGTPGENLKPAVLVWAVRLIVLKFQLVLGDYFRVYIFAAQIAESATDLIGWLNNHGKVCKIFNASQAQISLDWTGQSVILAYLTANLTWWTVHCVVFIRLIHVQDTLKLKVMQHHSGLIKAQVGAATSSKKQCLMQDTEMHCDLIADHNFWEGFKHVVGDIEPICYGTNINQKDSTRADQVLLTLAGMYIHFSDHPCKEHYLNLAYSRARNRDVLGDPQ
jgi:hypothetical protein